MSLGRIGFRALCKRYGLRPDRIEQAVKEQRYVTVERRPTRQDQIAKLREMIAQLEQEIA